LPIALSDAQVRELLSHVRNPIHKGCFSLMYACGLRVSEAATLPVTAIDSTNQLLKVIGKGNNERLIPLPRPIIESLRNVWRIHRNPLWLFPNRNNAGPLGRATLCYTFWDVAKRAEIKGATSHSLRHSYATRLMEQDVQTRVVQILLGHADISTTTKYQHLTEPTKAVLRDILDKLMTGL
jgi:integrase/recombinase XerD